jgi:hypothetical protein
MTMAPTSSCYKIESATCKTLKCLSAVSRYGLCYSTHYDFTDKIGEARESKTLKNGCHHFFFFSPEILPLLRSALLS